MPAYPASSIAKLFDLTERRIQQLAQEKIIPKSIKGKYELVPSVQGYIKYLKANAKNNKETESTEIRIEKVRLLRMQADKLTMEIEKEQGKLIDAKKAAVIWDNLVTRCKSVLLAIPNRLASQVIAINNVEEVALLLKQAIYEALTELSTIEVEKLLDEDLDQNETEDEEQELYDSLEN